MESQTASSVAYQCHPSLFFRPDKTKSPWDQDETLRRSSKAADKFSSVPCATVPKTPAKHTETCQSGSHPVPKFPPTRCCSAPGIRPPPDFPCSCPAKFPRTIPRSNSASTAGEYEGPPATRTHHWQFPSYPASHRTM